MTASLKRALLWGVPAVFAVSAIAGYRVAVTTLKAQVEAALGPESSLESIGVGFSGVTLTKLTMRAPRDWPAAETLRAERVTISPSLLAALCGRLRISTIVVEKPYLSVQRTPDEKLHLLPSLLERPTTAGAESPVLTIGRVELRGGILDFYDASVRTPALNLQLEDIALSVEDLQLPALERRLQIKLRGVLATGTVAVDGWAHIPSRDSEIHTRMSGVELRALSPYLARAAELSVTQGTLDLDLRSRVQEKTLAAPGHMSIAGLELADGGSFMGMPRDAVLFFLKDKQDRIEVDFTLAGNIGAPTFSLNELLSVQIAAALADVLGVSLSGVAGALGTVGEKGVQGLGAVAKGIGGLFSKDETPKPEEKKP